MRWLTNSYDSSSNEQLQQELEYTLLMLYIDGAVNQEMHLCKWAEEQRKQVDVKQ